MTKLIWHQNTYQIHLSLYDEDLSHLKFESREHKTQKVSMNISTAPESQILQFRSSAKSIWGGVFYSAFLLFFGGVLYQISLELF